ncbi:Alpha/Beta hydrolase protein [Apiospora marii]|uniref:Alpha/Beta hydrolase protein n=1 Tax=Apiospora marii TaxID=335849 RepID=UPI00312F620D
MYVFTFALYEPSRPFQTRHSATLLLNKSTLTSVNNCAPEANGLADRLKDGKRKVIHEVMEGMPHAFDKTCQRGRPEWDQMKKMNTLVINELKEALRV